MKCLELLRHAAGDLWLFRGAGNGHAAYIAEALAQFPSKHDLGVGCSWQVRITQFFSLARRCHCIVSHGNAYMHTGSCILRRKGCTCCRPCRACLFLMNTTTLVNYLCGSTWNYPGVSPHSCKVKHALAPSRLKQGGSRNLRNRLLIHRSSHSLSEPNQHIRPNVAAPMAAMQPSVRMCRAC